MFKLRSPLLVSASSLALTLSLHAVEMADLAGDWNIAYFDSPVALREAFYHVINDTVRTGSDS